MRRSGARATATLAAAALATAGACGLLPEDDFTGARVGDGIAPWTDLGPAPVCIGNQFLGPPASPPGGYCYDLNQIEDPCLGDDDCGSRETCVCGRCTVAYCAAASDCARGKVCSFSDHRCDTPCSDASACAPGEECFNGSCRGRCDTDLDCQTGEVCNSRNFCTTIACADDAGCMAGERCHVQRVPRLVVEPFAVASAEDPRVVLYVELGDATAPQRAIWRARSDDGVHFVLSPARPVVEDAGAAHAPSVIRTDAGWLLYYESGDGAALSVAASADGVEFGAGTVVLTGGVGSAAVRAPSAVVLPDGTVAVYYQIGDGTAIGLATGAPGGPLTAQGPVLTPAQVAIAPAGDDQPFWDQVVALRSPHAAITDGPDGPTLRVWFAGFGQESADSRQFGMDVPIPPNFSIGYAGGSVADPADLTPWPYGPVVDRVSAFLEHREEMGPGVVQLLDGDGARPGYLMYYVEATPDTGATGADGPFVLGRLGVLGNGGFSAVTAP